MRTPSARAGRRLAALAATAALAAAAPAQAAPPPNDAFANAQPLSAPAGVDGTTVEATREAGEPDFELESTYGTGTVWYSFSAPNTSRYAVADCGVTRETRIFVYTGSSLGDLQKVPFGHQGSHEPDFPACGDPTDRNPDFVVFDTTAGTTYWILVIDRFEGDNAPFRLTLDETPIPVFDSAIGEVGSKPSVKRGRTVTYTATLTNTGTQRIDQEWVELIASKPGKLARSARKVTYKKVTTTQGSCQKQTFFTRHHGALCPVGALDPGQSVVVKAKVKLGQSITQWAFLDYAAGRGDPEPDDNTRNDESKVTTRVKR